MPATEALVTFALARAAGSGAARAGTWGIRKLTAWWHARRVETLLTDPSAVVREFPDPKSATKLMEYLKSPEIEHFTTALAKIYLIERSGKKSDALLKEVETEFSHSIARFFGEDELPKSAVSGLFAAVNEAVLHAAAHITPAVDLSPAMHAQLVQTASSLAAASARNSELLAGIDKLDRIYRFQRDLSAQCARLHSSMRLPHVGASRQVPYERLFVPLNILLPRESEVLAPERAKLSEILEYAPRVVILGDPGGGKSTLAHKLTYDLATGSVKSLPERVPFLVTLRDYAQVVTGENRQSLAEYIEGLCRSPYHVEPPDGAVEYLLLNNRAVVILDGLDELLDTSLRRDVVQAVEGFAERYPTCPIVVTSRRIGYDEAPLNEYVFVRLEVGKFTQDQVAEYARKWFALDESLLPHQRDRLAESFITDSEYVADLRTNPLLLSLMCGIYASEGYIPANRPEVYEKCAMLLFERWDKQRGIHTPLPFDAHVQSALRALALYMFTEHPAEEGIPRDRLVAYMKDYLLSKRFDTEESAENAAVEFIEFCKGRAWVLTDVGADIYGFTHRTFLEYFAASQLVRLHPNASKLFSRLKPQLRQQSWDVVSQLAVQILGKNVEDGADDFLSKVIDSATRFRSSPDLTLVSFAARALEFVVPRPSVLRRIVDVVIRANISWYSDRATLGRAQEVYRQLLQNASRENRPRVWAAVREMLAERLDVNPDDDVALLLAIVSPLGGRGEVGERVAAGLLEWTNENRQRFGAAVELQRKRHVWVALLEWERGHLSSEEMLEAFGPRVFYEDGHQEWTGRSSIAYRYFWRRRFGTTDTLDPLVHGLPGPSLEKVARAVMEHFPNIDGPWLKYESRYDHIARVAVDLDLVEGIGADIPSLEDETRRMVEGAAILLALPLIEIAVARGAGESSEGDAGESVIAMLRTARQTGVVDDVLRGTLSTVLRDRELVNLIQQWAVGERDLVSFPFPWDRQRRRSARANPDS